MAFSGAGGDGRMAFGLTRTGRSSVMSSADLILMTSDGLMTGRGGPWKLGGLSNTVGGVGVLAPLGRLQPPDEAGGWTLR